MNAFISFLNSTLIERIFNRYTKKGLSQLVFALVLGYAGFSENFIELMVSYKWTFKSEYKLYIAILSLFILLIAGFNIFRKEHDKIVIKSLEKQLKEKQLILDIKKLDKELKNYEK